MRSLLLEAGVGVSQRYHLMSHLSLTKTLHHSCCTSQQCQRTNRPQLEVHLARSCIISTPIRPGLCSSLSPVLLSPPTLLSKAPPAAHRPSQAANTSTSCSILGCLARNRTSHPGSRRSGTARHHHTGASPLYRHCAPQLKKPTRMACSEVRGEDQTSCRNY